MNKIDSFRGENFFLSNFYEAPVTYGGYTFKNNEAAFQAQKCACHNIVPFTEYDPKEAKAQGRKVLLRDDWEIVKIGIMHDIVLAKFIQNPDLRDKLLATGDVCLEEGNNWGDTVWGTVNGIGENNLGKILMDVREILITLR